MTVLRTGGHPRNGPGTDGDVHQRVLSVLAGLLPATIGVGVPGFSFENDLTFVPRLPEARVPVYTRGLPAIQARLAQPHQRAAARRPGIAQICRGLNLILCCSRT